MSSIFFTFRDFKKEGGGTIRMYGVLNALAEKGEDVFLISNADDYSKFNHAIQHAYLNSRFHQKALFQALLAVFPAYWVYFFFKKSLLPVQEALANINLQNSRLFFFEYLDNSVGYVLKKKKKIAHYINDIHGISTIEFDYQATQATNFLLKLAFRLKFLLANRLDRKVFESADGIIYSSRFMKDYFETKYRMKKVTPYILPNLLSNDAKEKKINIQLKHNIGHKYGIDEKNTVIFFAGGYKPTAGIDDLLTVFLKAHQKYPNLRLMLIGEGPSKKEIITFVENNVLNDVVIFIDRVRYEDLLTYQSLADVIVCPDRMNEFSNMILHLKYLDSLVSGKIVVNGAFSSVREINKNEQLSINFTPSDANDLYSKLMYCIENKEVLAEHFSGVKDYALTHLTYSSYIKILME